MAYTTGERQRVYRTCRAIFSGDAALLRKLKKVRETLLKNKSSLAPLFQDFGEVKLADISRQLLESRIFESHLRAKVEFPDLFCTSPQRDAQREASEVDAAKSVADCLEEITRTEEQGGEGSDAVGLEFLTKPLKSELGNEEDSTFPQNASSGIPSLYPSYIPYAAQHAILTTAQKVLEECCYAFAQDHMPNFCQEQGWECASAVELTKWANIFDKEWSKISFDGSQPVKLSAAKNALVAVHPLRHTAVHRFPITARGISQSLGSAVKVAATLQDVYRAAQLEELKCEVDGKIKAIELSKNVLEDRATSQLEDIRRQREELEKQERRITEDMLKEDIEHKSLVGRLLEMSVRDIFEERAKKSVSADVEIDDKDDGVTLNGAEFPFEKTDIDLSALL